MIHLSHYFSMRLGASVRFLDFDFPNFFRWLLPPPLSILASRPLPSNLEQSLLGDPHGVGSLLSLPYAAPVWPFTFSIHRCGQLHSHGKVTAALSALFYGTLFTASSVVGVSESLLSIRFISLYFAAANRELLLFLLLRLSYRRPSPTGDSDYGLSVHLLHVLLQGERTLGGERTVLAVEAAGAVLATLVVLDTVLSVTSKSEISQLILRTNRTCRSLANLN